MRFPMGLRSLNHRGFRLFWTAQLVSLVGRWMQGVGQSWLVLESAKWDRFPNCMGSLLPMLWAEGLRCRASGCSPSGGTGGVSRDQWCPFDARYSAFRPKISQRALTQLVPCQPIFPAATSRVVVGAPCPLRFATATGSRYRPVSGSLSLSLSLSFFSGIATPAVRVLVSATMQTPEEFSVETLPAPHPALNAMLICDLALQEQVTGKTSLVGIFETVSAYQFPARHGFLSVYVKLTDVQGEYHLRLELVRLEELKVVGQGQIRATFADRMVHAELVFQIGDIVFEGEGRYEFRLYANGRWVGSKSLNVRQALEPRPPVEQIRVSGSTVTVRWLAFMLPAPKKSPDAV